MNMKDIFLLIKIMEKGKPFLLPATDEIPDAEEDEYKPKSKVKFNSTMRMKIRYSELEKEIMAIEDVTRFGVSKRKFQDRRL